MADKQKRQIAYKIRIKDILRGKYVKDEGWNPNYIELNGKRISRVNIIGTIVSKENMGSFWSVLLDDGTEKINARSFEQNQNLDSADIGDVVLVIGRPREYGNERYILIEIIKKIENKKWILFRKAEIDRKGIEEQTKENVFEKDVVTEEVIKQNSSADIVLERIQNLDKGEGADFEEVTKGIDDGEEVISSLLSDGWIFEITPGKLKILE